MYTEKVDGKLFLEELRVSYEIYGRFLNLLVSSVIFIDVYLSIKNPFQPREGRMKWYWLAVVIIMVITIICVEKFETKNNDKFEVLVITIFTFVMINFPLFIMVVMRLV